MKLYYTNIFIFLIDKSKPKNEHPKRQSVIKKNINNLTIVKPLMLNASLKNNLNNDALNQFYSNPTELNNVDKNKASG